MSVSASQITQMKAAIGDLLSDTAAVETYAGMTGIGASYGTSASVTCAVDSTRRLIRAADGSEAVSEFTLLVAAADEAKFTPGSRVTISSRTSTVLSAVARAYNAQVVLVEVACS